MIFYIYNIIFQVTRKLLRRKSLRNNEDTNSIMHDINF